LLRGTSITPQELDDAIMAELGLEAVPIATQAYPRKLDFEVARALAGAAGSASRFANDLTFLQSPAVGELAEPFGARQVGSSAMPFKRNPIRAESMVALGKFVASQLPQFWENAAEPQLERRMSDSANRRIALPQMFLALDEMLMRLRYIVEGLIVNEAMIARNLQRYGPFAATEPLLMALVKRGADRQKMHEVVKRHAMSAWEATQSGAENPLIELLAADGEVNQYLDSDEARRIADPSNYVGDAPARAKDFAAGLRAMLAD
jgi:adenylosuccinate lyase